jgi:hypothetical protein
MKNNPSPRELADEARQALRASRLTPREGFEYLIKRGIIDRSGRVLVCKLFGTENHQEADGTATRSSAPGKNGA